MIAKRYRFDEQRVKRIFSILILFSVFLFFFLIQYYQMPIGDDVLFRYKDSYYFYTLAKEWHPSDKISNISMMIDEVWNRWCFFSGRFSTVFFVPIMNILGEKVCAVIGAGVYIGIVACISRIIYGSWKEILLHPFELLFIFIYQFVLSSTGTYMVMWTFICHYGMPTLLCLLYYICWVTLMGKEQIRRRDIILLNILGIILGASHELLPLFCFIWIGLRSLIIYAQKEKKFFYLCSIHIGLTVGYLFCVFAPGNLVRMGIEHDIMRIQTDIVAKMKISMQAHMEALGLYDKKSLLILLIGILLLVLAIKKEGIKNYISKNLEYICASLLSIILWGLVAPPVPQYGLILWKAMIIICLIQKSDFFPLKNLKYYYLFTSFVFAICLCWNVIWCKDLVSVTVQRRERIKEAVDNGESSVIVPKYPDSTNKYITGNNIANDDDRYYAEIYMKYYGILILPIEE